MQTMIDLFSGCGGVTQGFKNQGYKVLAAVEWDEITAETYKKNHAKVKMYSSDIRDINAYTMQKDLSIKEGELDILSACAPCQPFSRHNRSKKKDERTSLILEVFRFAEAFRPKFILMENVPGLNKGKNKKILDQLLSQLAQELGYKVLEPHIIDAVNYGVPQFRKRLIAVCSRNDIHLTTPEITHTNPKGEIFGNKQSWVTVGKAFKGLQKLSAGQISKSDKLHKARAIGELNLRRLKLIPRNGGSRKSLPKHLQLACHQNKKGFNDVYGRMDNRKPANTLTTGCTNFTKGRYAHPTANRSVTIREAARLQTFPDNYLFVGNYDQISAQIGNAVPVKLAEAFARYFKTLSKKK